MENEKRRGRSVHIQSIVFNIDAMLLGFHSALPVSSKKEMTSTKTLSPLAHFRCNRAISESDARKHVNMTRWMRQHMCTFKRMRKWGLLRYTECTSAPAG